ncbi:MAG: ferredoxin [Streptosporangiaceae bacterium]
MDKDACIGSAMCVGIAPGRFALDERQRSGPVEPEIDADEVVRDAAATCPVEAISLLDADSGDPVDLD